MRRGFTPDDAKEFYDHFGSKQDLQAFYENKAIEDLIAHADFEHSRSVFELGFGTGKLAQRLFEHHLPADAVYFGIDISTTMARLAEERLGPWQNRVTLKVGDAMKVINSRAGSFDRFISTYVFDLLSPGDIRNVLDEAYRILKPAGQICLVSLTQGKGAWGRIVTRVWQIIYGKNSRLVGGCRPIDLLEHLLRYRWLINYCNEVSSLGITSQVVVASRRE